MENIMNKKKTIKHKLPFNLTGKLLEGVVMQTPEEGRQWKKDFEIQVNAWFREMVSSKNMDEGMHDSPYSPTTLPIGPYRGLNNPFNNDYSDSWEASDLWDVVEDMIDNGKQPKVVDFPINQLEATQDWLSSEAGDEALFPGYEKHPVVLQYGMDYYILDGHNRVAGAQKRRQLNITVFLFES